MKLAIIMADKPVSLRLFQKVTDLSVSRVVNLDSITLLHCPILGEGCPQVRAVSSVERFAEWWGQG